MITKALQNTLSDQIPDRIYIIMFINVLKRSSTVASSVSKYYVQSFNLHHPVPVLFKAPESRPIFVRSFQRTSLNCSDETKGESSLDKVAENLSVDIANVCIIKDYIGLELSI